MPTCMCTRACGGASLRPHFSYKNGGADRTEIGTGGIAPPCRPQQLQRGSAVLDLCCTSACTALARISPYPDAGHIPVVIAENGAGLLLPVAGHPKSRTGMENGAGGSGAN